MSVDQWTPVMIEERIKRIADRIAKSVEICDERLRARQKAERDYEQVYARAYMAHDGPQTEKRYAAVIASADEKERFDVADAAFRYADRLAKALDSELDAVRSIGVSVRQAYSTAGRWEP